MSLDNCTSLPLLIWIQSWDVETANELECTAKKLDEMFFLFKYFVAFATNFELTFNQHIKPENVSLAENIEKIFVTHFRSKYKVLIYLFWLVIQPTPKRYRLIACDTIITR